jgi:hypothetical protein
MKKKHAKKLELKKDTISNLSKYQLMELKGGEEPRTKKNCPTPQTNCRVCDPTTILA